MKIHLLAILAIFVLQLPSFSQQQETLNTEQQEVFNVVNILFDGMREGDSSKVHSAFRDNVTLYTSFTSKEGIPMLHEGNLQEFLDAVGTPHDIIWNEPIWNTEIRIDGNIANVWTEYAFYAGENFSHCGVDAFMLNKNKNGWKIFHLTDTRKRKDCNVPDSIKKK